MDWTRELNLHTTEQVESETSLQSFQLEASIVTTRSSLDSEAREVTAKLDGITGDGTPA